MTISSKQSDLVADVEKKTDRLNTNLIHLKVKDTFGIHNQVIKSDQIYQSIITFDGLKQFYCVVH